MYELLFLKPIFKEAVWGGNRLKDQFGYESQATIPVSAGLSVLMKMETVKWQRENIGTAFVCLMGRASGIIWQ